MAEPATRTRPKSPRLVHQFLIVLARTAPLTRRRIQVPETYSFWDLHVAIQGRHGLGRPSPSCSAWPMRAIVSIGIPTEMSDSDHPVMPGWQTRLAAGSLHAMPWLYLYDFGDGWEHAVMHESVEPAKAAKYPRCLAGARRCPPEDYGGVHGYRDFLKAIADVRHPEHAEMLNWIGGEYDADDFVPTHVKFDDPRKRWRIAFGSPELGVGGTLLLVKVARVSHQPEQRLVHCRVDL